MDLDKSGPIKTIPLDESAAASNVLVAAVSDGNRNAIRIMQVALVADSAVTATFEDEDGTNLSGPMALAANTPLVLPFSPAGWTDTIAAKGLNLLLGGAVQVSGFLVYQEIQAG